MDRTGSYTVGYIIGSLSAASMNRTLSKALIRLAPANITLVEIPIKDLPVYNRDFDADYPPVGRALKDAIRSVDAVLFVTPEYNRSARRPEKCHRLGKPPLWQQRVHRQAVGGDRRLTRQDRNRACPTTPAQCRSVFATRHS